MCSVKHSRKLATVIALLLWQKCLEFRAKKNFPYLKCLRVRMHYSFSFDPSIWWPLFLSTAALKGHAQFHTLHLASRIT